MSLLVEKSLVTNEISNDEVVIVVHSPFALFHLSPVTDRPSSYDVD